MFEELPKEKERYEKMNKFEKVMYKTGIYVLAFRKTYRDNIIPKYDFY